MKRLFLTLLTLAVVTLSASSAFAKVAWADGNSRGEDLSIYLVTFGVGDDIASWFGHTALLVRDARTRQQRVYNYGMFDFGPDMLPKFLMGRLEFWVADASVPHTIALYRALKRDIVMTELNLTPAKRKEVAEFLEWNIRPENRDYLYHHYEDNCATRVRDVIDKGVDGQFKATAQEPARLTFRGHTRRHSQRNPYIDVLLTAWMNDDIDAPIKAWDEMFLPSELLQQVEALQYTNEHGEVVPLVKESKVIYQSSRDEVPVWPSRIWPWTLLFGLLFGGVGFVAARKYEVTGRSRWRRLLGAQHFLAGLAFGLPGLVAYLFHLSDHTVTFLNENVLLMSPLTFLALPLAFAIMRGRPWALRVMRFCWYVMAVTSVLAVVLKVMPAFDQDNGIVIAMLLPFNILMAAAMHRFGPKPDRGALEPIAEGIWTVTSDRRFLDIKLGSRMTVVQLPDGGLWLHSPIPYDEALGRELDALGPVAHIVAPNLFHHMHVSEWAERYPEAKLYAAPGLEKKRDDLNFTSVLGEQAAPAWAGTLEQTVLHGAAALNEVVFYHPATHTLIVCDAVENFQTSDHLPTRLYLKLNRMERRFVVAPVVRAGFRDKDAAQASVDRILEWPFTRICLCHGYILESNARDSFREAFTFLRN